MKKRVIVALLYWGICYTLAAQKFQQGYFRNPLDIPILLAGSFGELRSNHFHTGLDIRTKGQEGLPVYAAADGWVSRINVSAYGYGNIIFISHSNGYTSVYAHLQKFSASLQKLVRQEQYKHESFEVNILPQQENYKVKKGELIGYSGNTGGSKAPHLHFEIRETITEAPVNPLLFLGSMVKDSIPPIIRGVKIYPLDTNSYVKVGGRIISYGDGLKLDVYKRGNAFMLSPGLKIEACGTIGIGVKTVDYTADFANFVAPYSVEMCVDKDRKYYQCMERLEFGKLRYINAHTDYEEFIDHKNWIERMFVLPNDSSSGTYYSVKDNGRINVTAQQTGIYFTVKDIKGHESKLNFLIIKAEKRVGIPNKISRKKPNETLVNCHKEALLKQENFYLKIPANILYDDDLFVLKKKPQLPKTLSPLYTAGELNIPLHGECEVGIKLPPLPEKYKGKTGILCSSRGFLEATEKDSWLVAKTKYAGDFCVMADITAPSIRPVNIYNGGRLNAKKTMVFKIADDLSGIKTFRGEIDGNWVLFEYDAKTATIWHTIDKTYERGMHKLKLDVTDGMQNIKTLEMSVYF